MLSALDLIHRVTVEGLGDCGAPPSKFNGEPYLNVHKVQSSPRRHQFQIAAFKAIKELEVVIVITLAVMIPMMMLLLMMITMVTSMMMVMIIIIVVTIIAMAMMLIHRTKSR